MAELLVQITRSSGKLMISSTLFAFVYLDKIVRDFVSSIDNTVLQKTWPNERKNCYSSNLKFMSKIVGYL